MRQWLSRLQRPGASLWLACLIATLSFVLPAIWLIWLLAGVEAPRP